MAKKKSRYVYKPYTGPKGFVFMRAVGADMALAGITSLIPFDEVVSTMLIVGKDIRPEYRETAKGGLAATPTGKAVAERVRRRIRE